MVRAGWVVLLAAAGLCALSGCVSVLHAPREGFTTAELDELVAEAADERWGYLDLTDEQRPDPIAYQVVPIEDWSAYYSACMTDEGFPEIVQGPNPYLGADGTPIVALRLADYTCQTRFYVSPSDYGYLSAAQSAYAYDYFTQSLIPCLVLHGITVTDPPSRESFIQANGTWNPYWGNETDPLYRSLIDRELLDTCAPIASGLPDFGEVG
jgi:hypothetical protein